MSTFHPTGDEDNEDEDDEDDEDDGDCGHDECHDYDEHILYVINLTLGLFLVMNCC